MVVITWSLHHSSLMFVRLRLHSGWVDISPDRYMHGRVKTEFDEGVPRRNR